MKRIGLVGPGTHILTPPLRQRGYDVEELAAVDVGPEDLRSFDLFVVAPFREDGLPLYDRFRELLGSRRVAVILLIEQQHGDLPESFLAGINDVLFAGSPIAAIVGSVERQTSAPPRRDSSSLARVRPAESGGAVWLGCAVNVSRTGVLLEVQRELAVGEAVELEFFLGDDPEPVVASGAVRRGVFDPERLRRSYGVAFTRIEPKDQLRIARFCEETE
ncbi:MAG: PilZ domain-containing protein [Thermoanaerobaculia bacterium]